MAGGRVTAASCSGLRPAAARPGPMAAHRRRKANLVGHGAIVGSPPEPTDETPARSLPACALPLAGALAQPCSSDHTPRPAALFERSSAPTRPLERAAHARAGAVGPGGGLDRPCPRATMRHSSSATADALARLQALRAPRRPARMSIPTRSSPRPAARAGPGPAVNDHVGTIIRRSPPPKARPPLRLAGAGGSRWRQPVPSRAMWCAMPGTANGPAVRCRICAPCGPGRADAERLGCWGAGRCRAHRAQQALCAGQPVPLPRPE
jgi:hypothetical protein